MPLFELAQIWAGSLLTKKATPKVWLPFRRAYLKLRLIILSVAKCLTVRYRLYLKYTTKKVFLQQNAKNFCFYIVALQ